MISRTPTEKEMALIEKLQQVSWEMANLNKEDVEGHVWWNRFKEFLLKGTDILECGMCNGEGFYYDHGEGCIAGECVNCPEKYMCGDCYGNGFYINRFIDGAPIKVIETHTDDLPF